MHTRVTNKGCARLKYQITGTGHSISVGRNSRVDKAICHINGKNNRLTIEDNVVVGKGCSFWLEGENLTITIKKGTTFTRNVQLNCQEKDNAITVGEDCMFSNTITVRTSDSHPIHNESGERLNNAQSVVIGNHVWIAPDVKIMKGSNVPDDCIIASDTTVSSSTQATASSLIAGRPAKVVKSNIRWTRETLF